MWTITCGICKHEADAEKFFTSEKSRYACPACGVVWRLEKIGQHKVTESGFVIPAKQACIVEPQMMLVAR